MNNIKQDENLFGPWTKTSFPRELQELLNKHSMENYSNTPGFILAQYLKSCLENFNMCIMKRDQIQFMNQMVTLNEKKR